MSEEVREQIFDLVTDPPCSKCEFWDREGHFCFLKDIHKTTDKCTLLDQILDLLRAAGWVEKDPDQSLPKNPFLTTLKSGIKLALNSGALAYEETQQKMLDEGWVKVKGLGKNA